MLGIKYQSISSDDGKPVGVILDIDTFHKIESIIEDHGLAHLMDEVSNDDELNRDEALIYYHQLKDE